MKVYADLLTVEMVFLRLFSRNIYQCSSVLRTNSVKIGTIRLLNKKADQIEKKNYATYEGDGKTVGFVLNKKSAGDMLICSVMTEGFVMSSGAEMIGSMVLFPHSILSWHVTTVEDITEDSLTLFKILDPKIDILVLGIGLSSNYTPEVRQRITQICRKLGLRFEALPTIQAVGLYNFLAEEGRFVAAALLPPSSIDKFAFDRSKDFEIDDDSEELESLPGDTQEKKLLP